MFDLSTSVKHQFNYISATFLTRESFSTEQWGWGFESGGETEVCPNFYLPF